MKILYVVDLHGNEDKYNKTFELAKEKGVDMVINGGDMYPKLTEMYEQEQFITDFLDPHFELYSNAGIYYLCYPGNDDIKAFDALLSRTCHKHQFVIDIAQRKFKLDGYEFIGFNYVTDYPFRLKDRCRMDTVDYEFGEQIGKGFITTDDGYRVLIDWERTARSLPTLEEELEMLVRPDDMSKAIYVIHMPPRIDGLDCAGVPGDSRQVGSHAVRRFLLNNNPLLSLHGHIHESPELTGVWCTRFRATTPCIQPGQHPYKLTYILIDLDTEYGKLYYRNEVDV